MNSKKLFGVISVITLFIIFSTSFYFGYIYSVFNTDFHHYSIILETYLDKKNGFELNKDIFVTYGNGQIYLFEFLSNFFSINLFSVGIINQFFFSLKFLVFFFILKFFFDNNFSLIGTLIYYFFYTFLQTASSDILASFFLHLFILIYLYNSQKQKMNYIVLSGILVFLTILFRHTYILNWIIFIFTLIVLNFFISNDLKYEKKIIKYFLLVTGAYFIFLYLNQSLIPWFEQFITLGLNNFLNIGHQNEMDLISRITILFYYLARIVKHIIIPTSFGSSYFLSIIFFINLLFILMMFYQIIFKKNFYLKQDQKILIILSLIAFSGSIQVIHKFEVARYLNASFTFLIVFFYLLNLLYKRINKKYLKIGFVLSIIIIFLPIISKYPFYANIFNFKLDHHSSELIFNNKSKFFIKSSNKIFNGKKFSKDYNEFYTNLENDLCKYSAIYNFSFDRSLHFLCNEQKKYIPGLYFKIMNGSITYQDLIKNNNENSIILTHNKIDNLELYKIYEVPKFYRFNKTDKILKFFSDKIYSYQIK